MLTSVQPQYSLLELKRPPKTVGCSGWSKNMKKKKIVSKKEVNMEEITQKLIKLRDELDDYYNNVFIPEYQDNTVFDTHRVDSPEVFDLVVRKKLSENKEILNEERQYWVNDDEIHSVDDLPSFQGLLEFEKQVPDSISQLNDDEIDQLINSLDSIQLTE